MRRSSLTTGLLGLALALGGCHAPPPPQGSATARHSAEALQADHQFIDLGSVYAGEERNFALGFSNQGSGTIPLQQAQGACGCTQLEPNPSTIEAGQRGEIRGLLRTVGFKGKIAKEVILQALPPTKALLAWEVRANVKVAVDFPGAVNLTTSPVGKTFEGTLALKSQVSPGETLLIASVESSDPETLKPTSWPEQPLGPGQKGEIHYRLTPTKEGPYKARLVIALSKPVKITLNHWIHTFGVNE